MTAAFEFGGKKIKIGGTGKISPSGSDIQFSNATGTTKILLTFETGSSITFDGFINTGSDHYGGAIFSSGGVEISGTSTFLNNSVNQRGGAICSFGDVKISDTSTFLNNKENGSNGGGAIYGNNVEISGTSTFSNNSANNHGGAIFGYSDVKISGTSTFSNNAANSGNGGAICGYGYGDVEISGISTFSNNSANSGGAIYSSGNVKISGTSTFLNNSASNNGGAIYSQGDVTITANAGDILFSGNKKAGSTPNAIYVNNTASDKTLSLSATNGNSILFYDPIASNSYNNLTIKINESGETGTVLFDMSNNGANRTSDIYGSTTVYNGTLALKGEAV
ncbi:MAG: hypothetical protein LBT09_01165, partial [Planctomycetaceae bacterium]|nr:hypothetical protein [Planctomycetaceae bacterium]